MIEQRHSDLARGQDFRMIKSMRNLRALSVGVVAVGLMVLPAALGASASAAELKVMVVNQTAIFQSSLAGRDAATKMQAILGAIESDAKAEMEPLAKEAQDLQGQRALLGDLFSKKQMDLQRRVEFIKYKYEQERKFTQDGAQRQIAQNLDLILKEIMQERKGPLLLDQSQIIMTSQDFNITVEVIKRLDARMPTVEVKRVTFAELQKAFEAQQASAKAAQAKKK